MEKTSDSQQKASKGVEDYPTDEIQELISTLPIEKNFDVTYLYQYQGFWYRSIYIAGMISAYRNFQARDSDTNHLSEIRNPLDQFISHWHFMLKIAQDRKMEPLSLEEAFESVSNGIQGFGPFWEHVLGYWKASLENPQKILFLKYEDVIENTLFYVKKSAEFLGCPFSDVEEKQGVIEEISKLCSFENMKDLEVNKTGRLQPTVGLKIVITLGKGR
ncbi:hypothetical protein Ddye_019815 [Dipteronia dyeriana]|uniref:Sulfotransferase n=1 Tax=Dipteronia dyeriana TaxID=168575 RepID=A0AAD9TZL2_9ROSI|nr:hypothetical protein Ddye_019815 [Dipteronia dyeriana]